MLLEWIFHHCGGSPLELVQQESSRSLLDAFLSDVLQGHCSFGISWLNTYVQLGAYAMWCHLSQCRNLPVLIWVHPAGVAGHLVHWFSCSWVGLIAWVKTALFPCKQRCDWQATCDCLSPQFNILVNPSLSSYLTPLAGSHLVDQHAATGDLDFEGSAPSLWGTMFLDTFPTSLFSSPWFDLSSHLDLLLHLVVPLQDPFQ